MDKYSFRVLWSELDREYVAHCPEFPGVSALAPTPEGALAEIRIPLEAAIETYEQEGWELPMPRYSARHSGQFRLRVPHSLHTALVERASEEGVSLNTLAVTYLAGSIGAMVARSHVARDSRSQPDAVVVPANDAKRSAVGARSDGNEVRRSNGDSKLAQGTARRSIKAKSPRNQQKSNRE